MLLKVTGFCETSLTRTACVQPGQLLNIFYQKRMAFIDADRDDFLKTFRGVLREVPQNFTVLLALELVDSEAEPVCKFLFLVQMSFYLFQVI